MAAVALQSSVALRGVAVPSQKKASSSSSSRAVPARCSAVPQESKKQHGLVQLAGKAAAAFAAAALVASSPATALTQEQLNALTYMQVKGTGIANTCTTVEPSKGGASVNLPAGKYKITKLCMEPTSFTVRDESPFKGGEPEFVKTKLMTRLTYTLDEIDGDATVGNDGSFTFKENDGIDYAATTVQLPGGERVPFLFTIKEFEGKGSLQKFAGNFSVPSYRGSTFLDPKGRGGSTGYDNAVALPAAADSEELEKENNKSTKALSGTATFQTAVVNDETQEIAGVFESLQPSDTDLGAKVPKDVKISGIWYAQYQKL
eukprot:jgi/Chlat1/2495/Chrsp175S02364